MQRSHQKPANYPAARPGTASQTVCRLVNVENSFFDKLDDANKLLQFEESFVQFQGVLRQTPDLNVQDFLSKHPNSCPMISKASIVGFLCEPQQTAFYAKLISLSSMRDNWQETLTNMNKVIIDGFAILRPAVRLRLIDLMEFVLLSNPTNYDCVVNNFIRESNNGSKMGTPAHVLEFTEMLCEMVLRNKEWFTRNTFNAPLVPCLVLFLSRIQCDMPPGRERTQSIVCYTLDVFFRERFRDLTFMGRELVLVMLRLAKVPMFRSYWKALLHNPRVVFPAGLDSIPKLLAQKCTQTIVPCRIAFRIHFLIDHLLTYKPEVVEQYHSEWFVKEFLSSFDSSSLRAEVIRFVVQYKNYNHVDTLKPTRVVFLFKLLISCKTPVEYQLAKQALFYDWICTDVNDIVHPGLSVHLDVLLGVLRHCFNNAHFGIGNSLIDHMIRMTLEFHPSFSHVLMTNLGNSMRAVSASQPGLLKIFDHPRVDKSVRTALSCLLPELFWKVSDGEHLPKKDERKRGHSQDAEPDGASKPAKAPRGTVALTLNQVLTGIQKETLYNIPIKLRELSAKLNGDTKKKLDVVITTIEKSGLESIELYESVKALLGKVKGVKLNDLQLKTIAECLHILCDGTVNGKKLFRWLKKGRKNVVFVILSAWQSTKTSKGYQKQTLSNVLVEMNLLSPLVSMLTLFFSIATSKSIVLYKDFIKLAGSSLADQLARDIAVASVEDCELLRYFVQKLWHFYPDLNGNLDVLETLCNYLNEDDMYILSSVLLTHNKVMLFERRSFPEAVRRSLEWSHNAQWQFWNLVKTELVPADWVTGSMHLLDDRKDSVACTNVLAIAGSSELAIDMNLVKDLFCRSADDSLTVKILTILMNGDKSTAAFAEQTVKLVLKLVEQKRGSNASKKESNSSSTAHHTAQNILQHLEKIRISATRDNRLMLYLKCEWFSNLTQNQQKKADLEKLRKKYSTLFTFWQTAITSKTSNNSKRKGKQTPKAEIQLRRKKNIDYVELSDDD